MVATWLKTLVQQRHLQQHDLFVAAYDKAASNLGLQQPAPSRAQFQRWLSGELKELPRPRHCQVLEEMFPQWTATELLAQATDDLAAFKSRTEAGPTDGATLRAKADHSGTVVDLHTRISIDIGDNGNAIVRYAYHVLNLTEQPIVRVARGIWFQYTHAPLTITPIQFPPHRTYIDRIHDAGSQHTKFAYHFSPPILPGATGQYGCEVEGGRFLDALYWRHTATKHTERFTVSVLHRNQRLKRCHATEELVTGTERLIDEQLVWEETDEGVSLELNAYDLEPTEVVTVRWEVLDPCS